MADGDSVKRALLNFMMKETFAFTQNCNEDSSTLGETTTTIGSGSATNLTETEASVESRSTLPSRRKESGRLLRQNSLVRSLVRPTMAGFLVVALLPCWRGCASGGKYVATGLWATGTPPLPSNCQRCRWDRTPSASFPGM